MRQNRSLPSALFPTILIATISFLLASCVAEQPAQGSRTAAEAGGAQPRLATYDCGEGNRITVENSGGSVRVSEPETADVVLPASPPAQRARYGVDGHALVLDGREALYMVAGRTPATCRR